MRKHEMFLQKLGKVIIQTFLIVNFNFCKFLSFVSIWSKKVRTAADNAVEFTSECNRAGFSPFMLFLSLEQFLPSSPCLYSFTGSGNDH